MLISEFLELKWIRFLPHPSLEQETSQEDLMLFMVLHDESGHNIIYFYYKNISIDLFYNIFMTSIQY